MSNRILASSTVTAEIPAEGQKAATRATSRTVEKQKAKKQTKQQQQQAQTSPQLQSDPALTPLKTPPLVVKKQPVGNLFYTIGLADALEAAEASKVKPVLTHTTALGSAHSLVLTSVSQFSALSVMVMDMFLTTHLCGLTEAAASRTVCRCLSSTGLCLLQVNLLLGIASRPWAGVEGRFGQMSPELCEGAWEDLHPSCCVCAPSCMLLTVTLPSLHVPAQHWMFCRHSLSDACLTPLS